jgi:hypothetical protein
VLVRPVPIRTVQDGVLSLDASTGIRFSMLDNDLVCAECVGVNMFVVRMDGLVMTSILQADGPHEIDGCWCRECGDPPYTALPAECSQELAGPGWYHDRSSPDRGDQRVDGRLICNDMPKRADGQLRYRNTRCFRFTAMTFEVAAMTALAYDCVSVTPTDTGNYHVNAVIALTYAVRVIYFPPGTGPGMAAGGACDYIPPGTPPQDAGYTVRGR